VAVAALLYIAGGAPAQTFTALYNFSLLYPGLGRSTNTDGASPLSLLWSSNTLYGATTFGGSSVWGTVFALNPDGTGFTVPFDGDVYTDGGQPSLSVILGNTLYGTAVYAGNSAEVSTVFTMNIDGTGFTTLHQFSPCCTNSDGSQVDSGLVLSGNTLYGTAATGGSGGSGTVFALSTDGSSFTTLYDFTPVDNNLTNSDGAGPRGGLVLSGSTLFGTTAGGGAAGAGTLFAIGTDGTGFSNLYSFSQGNEGNPRGNLLLNGSTLYGACFNPSLIPASGSVFAINTDGTGFRVLHSFSTQANGTNSDGEAPGLQLLSGNTLYGVTGAAGAGYSGTVFALKTDGAGFRVLHTFSPVVRDSDTNSGANGNYTNFDGSQPPAVFPALTLSGNTLYGIAEFGGRWGSGTIFSITLPSPPPQLTITPDGYGGYFINAQGSSNFACQLQRAPNLLGPWSTSASQTADTNGLIQFHDLFPPPGRAFYRTVQRQ
jgi:uncharacterized repeat protein (TIGR03803 family)